MGRRGDFDELVGAAEITQRLGLPRPQAVHKWRQRYDDFPMPVAELTLGLVWFWPDVERWARKTGRLPRQRSRSRTT